MSLKGFSAKPSNDGSKIQLISSGHLIEELDVIDARNEHRNFILSTWVRSYLPVARKLYDKGVYLSEEPAVAEDNWQHSKVLVSKDDGGFAIHGWCCGVKGHLQHVYVPPDLRGIGVAKSLIVVTCGTEIQASRKWPFDKTPGGLLWKYNPYQLSKPLRHYLTSSAASEGQ